MSNRIPERDKDYTWLTVADLTLEPQLRAFHGLASVFARAGLDLATQFFEQAYAAERDTAAYEILWNALHTVTHQVQTGDRQPVCVGPSHYYAAPGLVITAHELYHYPTPVLFDETAELLAQGGRPDLADLVRSAYATAFAQAVRRPEPSPADPQYPLNRLSPQPPLPRELTYTQLLHIAVTLCLSGISHIAVAYFVAACAACPDLPPDLALFHIAYEIAAHTPAAEPGDASPDPEDAEPGLALMLTVDDLGPHPANLTFSKYVELLYDAGCPHFARFLARSILPLIRNPPAT